MKYIIPLLCGFLFAACTKINNKNPVPLTNARLSALFNWQPGSYWLMEDSASGRIDSFYLKSHSVETYTYNDEKRERTTNALVGVDRTGYSENVILTFTIEYGIKVNITYGTKDSTITGYNYYTESAGNANTTVAAGGRTYNNAFYEDYDATTAQTAAKFSLAVNESSGMILFRIKDRFNPRTWTLTRSTVIRN